ncbi:MAG: hypothetical protein LBI87_11765 [Candidatus Accumulibacter sp.]|nr:hypothetical protein [Accumulibacter sp.]
MIEKHGRHKCRWALGSPQLVRVSIPLVIHRKFVIPAQAGIRFVISSPKGRKPKGIGWLDFMRGCLMNGLDFGERGNGFLFIRV